MYISQQVALWWIFHLSMVFCTVFWPFKYHYWKRLGYFKYIHTVMVAVALIVPIIPVVICYKTGGYVLYFLIRPDCVARNTQAAFYSHVVPLIAAVAIGLYLLILIFWNLFSEVYTCTCTYMTDTHTHTHTHTHMHTAHTHRIGMHIVLRAKSCACACTYT